MGSGTLDLKLFTVRSSSTSRSTTEKVTPFDFRTSKPKISKPLTSFWWVAFFNVAFCFGTSPFYLRKTSNGNYEPRSVKTHLIYHRIAALIAASYILGGQVWIFINCERDNGTYFTLMDELGDVGRILYSAYIFWYHKHLFVDAINMGFQAHSWWVPFLTIVAVVLFPIMDTFSKWMEFSGPLFLKYGILNALDSPIGTCDDKANLNATLPSWAVWTTLFPNLVNSSYIMTDYLFLICTAGMYCSMADETRRRIRQKMDPRISARSYRGGPDDEEGIQDILQFQDQIRRLEETVGSLLLVIVFAVLPYFVAKAVPSILLAKKINQYHARHLTAACWFFGCVYLMGIKHSRLANDIRAWMARSSGEKVMDGRKQLLLWDLSSNYNLALSLGGGIAYFNITLVFSLLSLTVTYTLVVWQFNQL